MARKRFSDLERIYDALNQANANLSTLPQNLDFVKYAKWKQGDGPERTITRPNLGDKAMVGIQAFGIDRLEETSKMLVRSNARATGKLNSLSAKTLYGHAADTTGYTKNSSFVPAIMRVATIVSATSETSAITGRKYKTKQGQTYSIPFGQTATVEHFKEAVDGILASADAETHSFSASPEQWRRD